MAVVTLPLISIVTATRGDDPELLRRAVASVKAQTYPRIEHIIISGDEPGSLQLEDEHIQYLPPNGVYEAVNQGLHRCQGGILGLVHGNDRLASPEIICKVFEAFTQHPEADYLYGNVIYRNANGRIVRRYSAAQWRPELLTQGWAPPHPSLYISRRAYERVGEYDPQFKAAADFDYFIRLNEEGFTGIYLPLTMVEMSYGGLSTSPLNILWSNTNDKLRVLRAHHIPASRLSLMRRYIHALRANKS